jgi:nucleoside-diphosphate-sugar epimerase
VLSYDCQKCTDAKHIYNVGERHTPTVAERLKDLPPSSIPVSSRSAQFEQNIVYDTERIRQELGYEELVSYQEGLRRTLELIADQLIGPRDFA